MFGIGQCRPGEGSPGFATHRNYGRNETAAVGAAFASRLNTSIAKYPLETCATMVMMDGGLVFGSYNIIKVCDLDFPVEFAFAFAISRVIKRFRFPLEVVVAAGCKRVFPAISTVRIMDLFALSQKDMGRFFGKEEAKRNVVGKAATYMTNKMNEYGLCYFVSSRLVGVSIVLGLYKAILLGIDVQPMIAYFGAESAGEMMGDWAGAVVLSSSLYPVTIYGVSHVAPMVGERIHARRRK